MTEQMVPAAPAEPEKESGGTAGKIIIATLAVVVVLGAIAFAAYRFLLNQPVQAKAGDCISDRDVKTMKVVECAEPEAKFKVYGVLEDKVQADGQTECAKYPEAVEFLFIYTGDLKDDTKGRILCIGATTAPAK